MKLITFIGFKEIKSQTLLVVLVWTVISAMILFKYLVLGPLASLELISIKDEVIAWAFSLIFIPLVVIIVNRSIKNGNWFSSISILILIALAVSFIWNKLQPKEVILHKNISGLFSTESLDWKVGIGSEARFFETEAFDMFSSYLFITGIAFAVSSIQQLRFKEINELKLRELLSQSKMNLLKSQIHPHFMFNTLNTVAGLMDKNVDKAQLVLEDLSFLLRISLKQSGQKEVSLQDEVEFIKKYLEIEQIRFGNKLNINWQISEECNNAAIPHMIIQPLVENSLKHGFQNKEGLEKLIIQAIKKEGQIIITIEDNGIGIKDNFKKGLGLRIVEERLNNMYGEKGELNLSALSYGTKVEILFPFKIYQEEQLNVENE